MNADSNILFASDFYKIIDFRCKCIGECKSQPEFSGSFNISFIRNGNFTYKVFRNSSDSYTGFAIIDKPGSEHAIELFHHTPDDCTVFDFTPHFYETIMQTPLVQFKAFFKNGHIRSILMKTNAEVEYLHHLILQLISKKYPVKIAVDIMVIELLEWFHSSMNNEADGHIVNYRLSRNHLHVIEQAKNYIYANFSDDISLCGISDYCNVSPFHFARIFKNVTGYSPYQFLLDVRLKNAEYLVRNSGLHFKEICSQSGFSSMEHFDAAFRKKFGCTPSLYLEKIPSLKKSRIS